MRRFLPAILLTVAALPLALPAGAQELKLWLDSRDLSTIDVSAGGVVDVWRDKSGLNNHLTRVQFSPLLLAGGGIELVERASGQTDALRGTALLAAERQEFAMILVCLPYAEAVRLFAFAGNHMSLLRVGNFADDEIGLQTLNNCLLRLRPAGIAPVPTNQIYGMRRIPQGNSTVNTLWRHGFSRNVQGDACFSAELHTLRFDNGSVSFPSSLSKGMVVFEVMAFAGAVMPAGSAVQSESVLTDAFIEGKMQELAQEWGIGPTPVQSTTWGRIKLLAQ